jgi:hypothetical protein
LANGDSSYRKWARNIHPDRFTAPLQKKQANRAMTRLNAARETVALRARARGGPTHAGETPDDCWVM